MLELLALLFMCHFLADFTPVSTRWMLRAKATGSPTLPIAAHGVVHGFLQFVAVYAIVRNVQLACCAGIIQAVMHTCIDIWKGRAQGAYAVLRDPTRSPHWVLFGADQLAHAITILGIVLYLQKNGVAF